MARNCGALSTWPRASSHFLPFFFSFSLQLLRLDIRKQQNIFLVPCSCCCCYTKRKERDTFPRFSFNYKSNPAAVLRCGCCSGKPMGVNLFIRVFGLHLRKKQVKVFGCYFIFFFFCTRREQDDCPIPSGKERLHKVIYDQYIPPLFVAGQRLENERTDDALTAAKAQTWLPSNGLKYQN